MKPYLANLINAIILVVIGLWGYLGSETPSATALIPVIAGAVLILITPPFKKGNKVIAHIAVVLVFAIIIAFIKPLTAAIGRNDQSALARVIIMMASSVFALAVFIKSFVDARIKN